MRSSETVWSGDHRLDLPRLDGDVEADVCVVGLGGSGLSAITELLRLGQSVVGIDVREVGGGAAGRNGGFLLAGTAPFYHDAVRRFGRERAHALYMLTLAEIDRFVRDTPDVVRRTGSLRIAASREEEDDCRRQLDAMLAGGLPVEAYEGPEGSGLLMPRDAVYQPLRRCQILAERCRRDGTSLFERTPAVTIERESVTTPFGGVRCRAVIVAVDGGLERVLPELAGRIRTARLQMLATAPTAEVMFHRPVYTRWGFDYWQQLPDGRLALGGFRDRFEGTEWTVDAQPTEEVQSALIAMLREKLRVHSDVTHQWAAPVGFSTTDLPYLGEVRPGVWAVGGYNGTGNLIGSICGRAAAQLAAGGKSDVAELFR